MEDFKKVEDLVDHVKEYVHVRVDEARLGLAERSSGVLASLIAAGIVAAIFFLACVFACTAAALLLGHLCGSYVFGFLIVAGFLLLAGGIVWWSKQRLIRIPIMNAILNQLFETSDHEDN
jgi:Putative Actinobacterial Holin-X, holin superfamily III